MVDEYRPRVNKLFIDWLFDFCSHEQFLKLHKDATGDTKFRWQVNLR